MKARWKNRLGYKFIAQIIIFNALLSVIASSVQLFASYQRDHSQVLVTDRVIDQGFRSGFEAALWEFNFPLAEALLDGVYAKEDVAHATLTAASGQIWERGTLSDDQALTRTLEFSHAKPSGEQVQVGKLEIGLTLTHIRNRVWSQLWTLLLSNFAKTACASILMLMLFEHHISRHLAKIASHVSENSWPEAQSPIALDRNATTQPDDLDHIVNAINLAKSKSREDFAKLAQEIKHRQQTEDALRHKADELELANSEQSQFTYAISHDLKSPANTVAMLLRELEQADGDQLSMDGKEILHDANRTITRMKQLVEDVLGYARTVKEGMHVETVDLQVIATEIVEDLRSDIESSEAEVIVQDLPTLQGNRAQLRMLLQNLLGNAIKFRSPDRLPRITLQSVQQDDPDKVSFSVCDNGIGIAPEYHETVFGLFKRLHAHSRYGGSGLGLTLCKRIVVNHLGRIEISSPPEKGTFFKITLMGKINGT